MIYNNRHVDDVGNNSDKNWANDDNDGYIEDGRYRHDIHYNSSNNGRGYILRPRQSMVLIMKKWLAET